MPTLQAPYPTFRIGEGPKHSSVIRIVKIIRNTEKEYKYSKIVEILQMLELAPESGVFFWDMKILAHVNYIGVVDKPTCGIHLFIYQNMQGCPVCDMMRVEMQTAA